MKYLIIGDLHITKDPEVLAEASLFIEWVFSLCGAHDACPLFVGDIYHYHGIVHVEVVDFWHGVFNRAIQRLGKKAIVIPGNHDCNHAVTHTALIAHEKDIILAWPDMCLVPSGNPKHSILAVRFYRDPDQFVKTVNDAYARGVRVIVCHQEFNGAQYENGFYAPGGVDPSIFPPDLYFLVGHIHKAQSLGTNVHYIGSSRQIKTTDLGETKGVILMDTAPENVSFERIEIPGTVFEPFVEYIITEENKKELKTVKNSPRSIIRFEGTEDFCKKMTSKAPSLAKVRQEITDCPKIIKVKESVGVATAFRIFLDGYVKEHPEDSDRVSRISSRIFDKCSILKDGGNLNG